MLGSAIEQWRDYLIEQEMPVLKHTAQNLSKLATDQAKHISALTNLILQDAGMTAAILRVAKSAYYNPSGVEISTISRAILVLGSDEIRSMCVSFAIIDTFLKGETKSQVIELLSRSFHSAVQAKNIAKAMGEADSEEIFIAALLYRLGELMFWTHGKDAADKLLTEYNKGGVSKAEAERSVLGFSLTQLRKEIAQQAKLSKLLGESYNDAFMRDDRVQTITLTDRLAEISQYGWDNPQLAVLCEKVSIMTGTSSEEAKNLMYQGAQEAVSIARSYGATEAAKLIPVPEIEEVADENGESLLAEVNSVVFYEADPVLQLKILRDLSALFSGTPDFDTVLQMVLEGIYRGVGMDHVFFALLTPDRSALEIKFSLGPDRAMHSGIMQLGREGRDIVLRSLQIKQAFWMHKEAEERRNYFLPGVLRELIGREDYLIAPALVGCKSIGVFFADRAISERPINKESFEAFKHFVEQANLGLAQLAKKN